MKRLALVLLLGGCAHESGAVALTQIQWSGPPPHVGVQLAGAGASNEAQAQCETAALRSGVVVDANGPVQAIVTLDPSGQRIDVLSQRRGVVRSQPRSSQSLDRLCAEAAVAAAVALRDESAGSSMDAQTSSYAISPVRSQDLHSPTTSAVGPEPDPRVTPLGTFQSSGPVQ